jgi:hypothetical protein
MANETITSGLAFPAKVYSDAISAAFVKKPIVLPLIFGVDWNARVGGGGVGSNVITLRKDGSLTDPSSAVSEGANFTTNSQYQTTSVDITIVKHAISSFVTVEALDVIGLSEMKLVQEQANALARQIDTAVLALAAGFTTTVTSTALLTVDDLFDSQYNVVKNTNGVAQTVYAVISRKSANALRKELISSGASAFSLPTYLSLLGSPGADFEQPNGYVGGLPGIECFATSGFATDSGNDRQMVFDPNTALAGSYQPSVSTMVIPVGKGNPSFGYEISSYIFGGCVEWNDLGGVLLQSDT